MATSSWFSGLTRHSVAANASALCFEYAETPMLMPPIGGFAGCWSSTAGYCAAPICLKICGAFSFADG